MKITISENFAVDLPEEASKLNARQYLKMRICAAKMGGLSSDLAGMREKIAAAMKAIEADDKAAAAAELNALYYSCHLSVTDSDPAAEMFAWMTIGPAKAATATDGEVMEFYRSLVAEGLTWGHVKQGLDFFLPTSGLA
jgi:hypothetical protein